MAAGQRGNSAGSEHDQRRERFPGVLEATCYIAGLALLVLTLGGLWRGEARAGDALTAFPDTTEWSQTRRNRYQAAMHSDITTALAVLRIPRLELEVPVYPNAGELELDRGAGVVEGMAYPRELGHIGIAGHRDGYFRALKDIAAGDHISLATSDGTQHYVVDELLVVDPARIDLLADTGEQRLTLVTCYPFYYLGPAPNRLLVRALPAAAAASAENSTGPLAGVKP